MGKIYKKTKGSKTPLGVLMNSGSTPNWNGGTSGSVTIKNNNIAIGSSASGIYKTPGSMNSNGSYQWSNSNTGTYTNVYQNDYIFEVQGDATKYPYIKEGFSTFCTNILDDKIVFNTTINGKRNEPLETIFELINDKVKLNVTIQRASYNLLIQDVQFIEIENLYSSLSSTSLTVVIEKSDDINYENTLLSITEKRQIKIEAIKKKLKERVKDDI